MNRRFLSQPFFVAGAFTGMPDKYVKLEGAADYVETPGGEGCFGVLVNHAAMASGLAEGALEVRDAAGAEKRWNVSGGFFEGRHNQATVPARAFSGSS